MSLHMSQCFRDNKSICGDGKGNNSAAINRNIYGALL